MATDIKIKPEEKIPLSPSHTIWVEFTREHKNISEEEVGLHASDPREFHNFLRTKGVNPEDLEKAELYRKSYKLAKEKGIVGKPETSVENEKTDQEKKEAEKDKENEGEKEKEKEKEKKHSPSHGYHPHTETKTPTTTTSTEKLEEKTGALATTAEEAEKQIGEALEEVKKEQEFLNPEPEEEQNQDQKDTSQSNLKKVKDQLKKEKDKDFLPEENLPENEVEGFNPEELGPEKTAGTPEELLSEEPLTTEEGMQLTQPDWTATEGLTPEVTSTAPSEGISMVETPGGAMSYEGLDASAAGMEVGAETGFETAAGEMAGIGTEEALLGGTELIGEAGGLMLGEAGLAGGALAAEGTLDVVVLTESNPVGWIITAVVIGLILLIFIIVLLLMFLATLKASQGQNGPLTYVPIPCSDPIPPTDAAAMTQYVKSNYFINISYGVAPTDPQLVTTEANVANGICRLFGHMGAKSAAGGYNDFNTFAKLFLGPTANDAANKQDNIVIGFAPGAPCSVKLQANAPPTTTTMNITIINGDQCIANNLYELEYLVDTQIAYTAAIRIKATNPALYLDFVTNVYKNGQNILPTSQCATTKNDQWCFAEAVAAYMTFPFYPDITTGGGGGGTSSSVSNFAVGLVTALKAAGCPVSPQNPSWVVVSSPATCLNKLTGPYAAPGVLAALRKSVATDIALQCVGFVRAVAAGIGAPLPLGNASSYNINIPPHYTWHAGAAGMQVGDIGVWHNGGAGHIAVIIQMNANGSFVTAEANGFPGIFGPAGTVGVTDPYPSGGSYPGIGLYFSGYLRYQ